MREKTLKVVFTFASVSDAMAAEEAARRDGIPGRIIPLPTQIAASCGLSWAASAADRAAVEAGFTQAKVAYEGVHEVSLY